MNELQIAVEKDKIELERVGKVHEDTGRQLLLLKFMTELVRKEMLRKAQSLRNYATYGEVYINPVICQFDK